jgi:DNA topoisomerase VI subunit B
LTLQRTSRMIVSEQEVEWHKEHGTRVEIDLEGDYLRGNQSVDEYIIQTAIINPHTTIIYQPPEGCQQMFVRATEDLPKEPKEIKPHPMG